jgi:hypothetical protein
MTITSEPGYVTWADASVITLVGPYAHRDARLVDNGGFMAVQNDYPITFGEAPSGENKLSLTVNGEVTNGAPPVLNVAFPIVVPMAASGSGAPDIDWAYLLAYGNRDNTGAPCPITAIDAEDPLKSGTTLPVVEITDPATGRAPSIAADSPGVYQVRLSVTDSDGNTTAKLVAVVIQDGNYAILEGEGGYILRAVDFPIDSADVDSSDRIGQIREQGDVHAWRNDGGQATAVVVSDGGYSSDAGKYFPEVAIYDNDSQTPSNTVVSKQITVTVNPAPVPATYRVTFDANGGVLIGPRVITVTAPRTTLPYLPSSPIRDGYTFRYWATAPVGGVQFTEDTQLSGDVTVFAVWQALPATPAPQPPVVNVTYPPAGGNTYITNPPGEGITYVTVEPEPETTLADERVPLNNVEIDDEPPPLDSGEPTNGWSLFNLIAVILALFLLVAFFIRFFFNRPRAKGFEDEPLDAALWESMTPEQRAQYQAQRDAEYQAWQTEQYRNEARPKVLLVNAPVLLIAAAALIEALIVLFSTQDFTGPMVIVDDYSVVFALVVFVQLLAPMVAATVHNSRQGGAQPPVPPVTPLPKDDAVTL